MSDDGYRYCYTAEDGELVEKRKIADHEVLGMVHYPNANSMLVFSQKGEITMWTVPRLWHWSTSSFNSSIRTLTITSLTVITKDTEFPKKELTTPLKPE